MKSESEKPVEGEIIEQANDVSHSKSVEIRTVEDVMEDSFIRYSMSVIVDRALPDVRDGMKPVHRRIVYVMDKMGIGPTAKTVKSAQVSTIRTATARFMMRWCVWLKIGWSAIRWFRAKVTLVQWTVTRRQLCVIPKQK